MFLGIDLGLGSLKASVVNLDGALVGEASAAVSTSNLAPGIAEQNPDHWDKAMALALSQLNERGLLVAIDAISFTAGTHSTVLLDEAGEVLRPAIMWADQRSAAEAEELNARLQDRLIAIGHNRAAPTWSIAPLLWLTRHEPETVARARRVTFVKDWLRGLLTNDTLTDWIDAQGSLMMDVEAGAWSVELCDAIGWDMTTLPALRGPTDLAGHVTSEAAAKYGVKAGTPVYVGTCDTAAEVWSAGAIEPGDAVVKLASAGVVNIISDRPTKRPDAPSKRFVVPHLYYALGAINSCASAHKWLTDMLLDGEGAEDFARLDALAAAIAPGSGGVMFHPYLMGERAPYWDPALRASFIGMNLTHGRGHLVRAFYEGIALALRDAARPLQNAGLSLGTAALIGGGARSEVWAQTIADVLQIPLRRPVHGDASYGAALIAAVGAGAFPDPVTAVRKCVRFGEPFLPRQENRVTYDRLFDRYRRTKDLLTALNHEISAGQAVGT